MRGLVLPPGRYAGALASTLHGLFEVSDHGFSPPLADEVGLVWQNRLTNDERAFLLAVANLSVPIDCSEDILAEGAGLFHPLAPPFLDLKSEARDWAAFASQAEKRAFVTAIWPRLAESDRDDFLKAVSKRRRSA